jgi:F0F1-type ATP synthase membrane subunit c/vacuolar-type H+-ATPase subunit K
MAMGNGSDPNLLQAQRLTTRVIAFGLWMAVGIYVVIFAMVVLKGDPMGFFAPIGGAPWGQILLPVLCAMAATLPAAAFVLRRVFLARAQAAPDQATRCNLERTAMIVAAALFESVAVFGLVLGFVLGPATAPVAALMFLVPLFGIPFLLPPHARFGVDDRSF